MTKESYFNGSLLLFLTQSTVLLNHSTEYLLLSLTTNIKDLVYNCTSTTDVLIKTSVVLYDKCSH